MPNSVVLPVNAGILPQGLCAQSYQELLNSFSNVQTVTLPTESDSFVIQSNSPPVADRGQKFWLQLDTLGRPVRIYWYAQGYWLSQHPEQPGMIKIWTGSVPDFTTFDGGDAQALTPYSGPMWEIATELNALFPVGAQQGVSLFASGKAVNPGDKGGEELHSLTVDEIPPHQHFVINKDSAINLPNSSNTLSFQGSLEGGGSTDYVLGGTATEADRSLTSTTGGVSGAVVGHNTLPPYLGVTFLKRTTRLFYSVL